MTSLYSQQVQLLFNVRELFAFTDHNYRHERWRIGHFFLWMWKNRESKT